MNLLKFHSVEWQHWDQKLVLSNWKVPTLTTSLS